MRGIYWPGLLGYCLVIFWLSSLPRIQVPQAQTLDKLYHALEYALLGFLFFKAAVSLCAKGEHKIILFSFIFSLLYGAGDEWHQSFVPGREASLLDVAADGLGGFLGAALAGWFSRHRTRAEG